jgi:CRISPR-associated protein Csd2
VPTIAKRYDFAFYFDVQDGNPNGDPDAGNMPRQDPETNHGLVTDVALKRKVRDYVLAAHGGEAPHAIYVSEGSVLNDKHTLGWTEGARKEPPADKSKAERGDINTVRDWMCATYFDVRTFGAVMDTEVRAGQVRGAVQFTAARSIEPILVSEHAITRVAVTNAKDLAKERTIGRKYTVPYALYVAHGFISPLMAAKSGFSADDLALLWQALAGMFDLDRSAARGMMATRGLFVFQHESPLGNAPAADLFDRITVERTEGVAVPRHFRDYRLAVNREGLPRGVELIEPLKDAFSAAA